MVEVSLNFTNTVTSAGLSQGQMSNSWLHMTGLESCCDMNLT